MDLKLAGIYPPIPTSFNNDETINEVRLLENLEKWKKFDLRGIVVLGSNGEFPYLSSDEKIKLVDLIRKNIPEQLVIAGAGCEGTKETIDMCNKFFEIGADAALIHTPHFYRNKMTDGAMINHYRRIADHSKLPIILYNVPANTGVELSKEAILTLAPHPNIIGLKDSSGDIKKLSLIVKETEHLQNFQVLAGSAGFLADAMEQGCVGGICALANVLPEETLMLFDLMRCNRVSEAKILQEKLSDPNAAVTKRYGVPALKHVMDCLGYYGGPTRYPLLPLTTEEKKIVENAFQDFFFTVANLPYTE